MRVLHVARNLKGRDYAVGDIHGHTSRLFSRLREVGFNPDSDRLFSVGDLVDRGPECVQAVELVDQPWFYAVRGNHDDFAIQHLREQCVDELLYRMNGGDWFLDAPASVQEAVVRRLETLPFAIQVPTAAGNIGIVHADIPWGSWDDLEIRLQREDRRELVMWSRMRVTLRNTSKVAGIDHLVVGHNRLREPLVLGNVHHIDTGGWRESGDGRFCLLNLDTMAPV